MGKNCQTFFGFEKIGVVLTFRNFSYEENYNLNHIMTKWLKKNWVFPFMGETELGLVSKKYGFSMRAIESWLVNARFIAWEPLHKLNILPEGDDPNIHFQDTIPLRNDRKDLDFSTGEFSKHMDWSVSTEEQTTQL